MEEDNVIYVQVDEQGRVVNYTSNNAIGDQLVLLQEDGQSGQAGTSVQQTVGVAQAAVNPTLISQSPILLPQPTAQPGNQPAAQPSTPPVKPTIINLASLPSGLTLVGATKSITQTAGGVRIAPKTGSQGPLSPGRTTTVQQLPTSSRINLSPDRITINPKTITLSPQKVTSPQDAPQKFTINPQTLTLNPQNIKLSPQKIGNVSVLSAGSARPSVGQIRVTPPGKSIIGTQSILTTSGMKQVSLLGPMQNKISIKAGSPAIERLSLDQLVSSGGVTLQRISSSTQGLPSTHVVTDVNSTTGNDAVIGSPEVASQVISGALTSQNTIPDDVMASQHEGVSYAKPDTTTDEASLLDYQLSEPHVTTADNVGLATDTISSGAQELMTSSLSSGVTQHVMMSDTAGMHDSKVVDEHGAKVQDAVGEGTVSGEEKLRDPGEMMDETLEEYLAGDSDVISEESSANVVPASTTSHERDASRAEAAAMDVGYSDEERDDTAYLSDKSENEAASQSEDECDDEFPAGLIRGEPVFTETEQYTSAQDDVSSDHEKETEHDEELVPAEITSVSPRKNRLPLTAQGEPSDTESVPMQTEDEEQFEIDIKEQLTSTKSSATKVRSRKSSQKSTSSSQEAPEESGKKDFMKKNFNLFTPREIEEQKSKRRSARISNAEQQQQAEAELEKEEQTKQQPSADHNKDVTSGTSTNGDAAGATSRQQQNVFDIFGLKDDSTTNDPERRVTKLQAVNTELKARIRQLEQRASKSPTSKYKDKMQLKQLQRQLERMGRLNEELAGRLQEYEGKSGSPPERRVDMTYKHGKFSFSTPVSTFRKETPRMDTAPSTSQQKRDLTLIAKNEQKVRALHNELDQRTSMLKARESRINRLVVEIKERENKVVYREQALLRRVQDIEYRERILEGKTKAAIEKRNKQGGALPPENDDIRSKELIRFEMEQRERDLKRRENEVATREQQAENKEDLLKMTEKQLAELHNELKTEYEQKHGAAKQVVEDLFGTPRTTYLSQVGATPKSGRPGRLRKSTGSGFTPTGSDAKAADAGTSADKRMSRSDFSEETPVRQSRRETISRESSVDSKQESNKSSRQQQSESNRRTGRQTPRRGGKAPEPSETGSKAEEETPVTSRSRRTPKRNESVDDTKDDAASDKAPPNESTERRGRSRRSGVENKSTPVEEKSRKTPRRNDTESKKNEDEPAPSNESTERRGRSRKSTVETPKAVEETPTGVAKKTPKASGKSILDVVATLSKRQQEKDQTTSAGAEAEEAEAVTKVKDQFDFESESHQSETSSTDGGEIKDRLSRSKKGLTSTKGRDLKQTLKGTKRPRDGSGHVAVLRKRSRSHSASPAPSDVKRKKE